MTKKKIHVIVRGRVQGVFFRDHTRDKARSLNLSGWVRNRKDGTVEAVIEGEALAVEKMFTWLHSGSPSSRVDDIQVTEEPPTGENSSFEII